MHLIPDSTDVRIAGITAEITVGITETAVRAVNPLVWGEWHPCMGCHFLIKFTEGIKYSKIFRYKKDTPMIQDMYIAMERME